MQAKPKMDVPEFDKHIIDRGIPTHIPMPMSDMLGFVSEYAGVAKRGYLSPDLPA